MYRFCTNKNISVIGGASKLFKFFITKYNPKEIISYANRRWSKDSENNLYRRLGFNLDSITKPSYSIVQGTFRKHRSNYQKHILINNFDCPENISEHEFTLSKHWWRIYDCGNLKYIWKNPNN